MSSQSEVLRGQLASAAGQKPSVSLSRVPKETGQRLNLSSFCWLALKRRRIILCDSDNESCLSVQDLVVSCRMVSSLDQIVSILVLAGSDTEMYLLMLKVTVSVSNIRACVFLPSYRKTVTNRTFFSN